MLLTNQQQFILDTLKKLGCVTRRQLSVLIRTRFCRSNTDIAQRLTDTMLRQMRCGNVPLLLEGETVKLPGRVFDARLAEAVDVMLELSEGAPTDFSADQPAPVLLRFTTPGARIGLFAVIHAETALDVCAGLAPMPAFTQAERVVVLLDDDGKPPRGFTAPGKCFFARRQTDGTHRFYINDDSKI